MTARSALESPATDAAFIAAPPAKIVDCHVHLAALPDGVNGDPPHLSPDASQSDNSFSVVET